MTSLYCLAYESTKIGHIFRDKEGQKWKESKNVTNEKCSTKSVSLKMIKINSRMIKFTFDIGIGIEIKVEFEKKWLFFILYSSRTVTASEINKYLST